MLLLFQGVSYGQTESHGLGFKFGVGNTGFVRTNIMKPYTGTTVGYGGSLFYKYGLGSHFSMQGGLSIDIKGDRIKNVQFTDELGNPLGDLTSHSRLTYLTLPVMVKYSLGKKIKFFTQAGVYGGYLFDQKQINPEQHGNQANTYDLNFKQLDWGITAGIGMGIPVSKSINFLFELNSSRGISNINNDYLGKFNGKRFVDIRSVHHKVLMIQLGAIYHLKSRENISMY